MIGEEGLKRLQKIRKQIEDDRRRYDDVWKEAARFIDPNMSDWNDEPDSGKKPDETAHIYDNTAQRASQTLTDGVQGYAFARNQAWFKSSLEGYSDLEDAAAMWLQKAEKEMYGQLQRSNYYDEARTFVKCCADFGTAIMIRIDDVERKMPVYKVQHLKRCCIAESRYGEADTLFRDFWIDAYQAGQQFGEDTLPDTVRQAKKNGSLKLWKFTQAIIPPEKYEIGVSKRNGFEYYSVMWADVEKDKPLLEGWYVLKPFFVWRWSRNLDGGPWGVDAPGMLEISNIKQLNQMRKDRTRASQLSVQPPYKATEGLEGRINLRPNGFTYVRPGQDFTPVPTSGRIDAFDQDIALLQKSINSAYFTDLFLILSQNLDKQKTATEVSGIQGEKAALMSSFYGRLTAEFLEPCLEDLFALELMAGRIPPPPDSLRQSRHGLRFDMVSPLAQMQERYLTLGSSQQAMAEIAALSQMRPEILDNIDLDQYVRTLVDAYGMDKRIIVNMADVRRMRQARAQAQAQMQQFAMQQEAAKTGAEVMSALPPEAAGGIQQ